MIMLGAKELHFDRMFAPREVINGHGSSRAETGTLHLLKSFENTSSEIGCESRFQLQEESRRI